VVYSFFAFSSNKKKYYTRKSYYNLTEQKAFVDYDLILKWLLVKKKNKNKKPNIQYSQNSETAARSQYLLATFTMKKKIFTRAYLHFVLLMICKVSLKDLFRY
jgi:hypothetical protein